MLVPFQTLPNDSRIWVYQTQKVLTDVRKLSIEEILKTGIENWNAHGHPLTGGFTFVDDFFLIIAVDQHLNMPSGCSIDASTHWIKEIAAKVGINFLDRSLIYKSSSGIALGNVFQIKKMIEEGLLNSETLVYNTHINVKELLKEGFLVKAKDSQLARFF